MHIISTIFLSIFLFGKYAIGFSTGAPNFLCNSALFIPQHGKKIFPQLKATNPYIFVANVTEFSPNINFISVTIIGKSKENFKGFFLKAIDTFSKKPIGRFKKVKGTKVITNCSAITHSDPSMKNQINLLWYPPKGKTGNVRFSGTVAQTMKKFWHNINSISQ